MCDRINTFNVNLSCIILYLSQIKPRSKVFIIYVEREGLKKIQIWKAKEIKQILLFMFSKSSGLIG